jgi:glycosyltransferase involved in cell wall biosynthesis
MTGGVLLASEIPFWRRDSGASQRIAALADVIAAAHIPVTVYYPNTLTAADTRALSRHRRFWELSALPFPLALKRAIRRRVGALMGRAGLGPASVPAPLKRPWPEERIQHFQTLCDTLQPKVILIEYLTASYLLDGIATTKGAAALKVVDTHDVLSERVRSFKKRGAIVPLVITPEEEAQALQPFDVILAIQEHEAELLRGMAPGKQVVLVGHGQEITPAKPRMDGPPHALFFASRGEHNHLALKHMLNRLWPEIHAQCPEAELIIAGGIADELETINVTGVKVIGRVGLPREAYEEADVVLNPILAGSGLKIKNVEALCHAMPLVTTPTGAEGLEAGAGEALIVADEDADFVHATVELLRDRARQLAMRESAAAFARNHLSPDNTFAPLIEIIKQACGLSTELNP